MISTLDLKASELPFLGPAKSGWPWQAGSTPPTSFNERDLPSFSIIVPSYQQGQFLEETLRSILLQNYPKLELIVIDGGSSDQSKSILEAYEPWISYWQSEKDQGTWDADNQGLEKMTGDYWAVVNSDDLLLADALWKVAKQLLALEQKRHWLTAGVIQIDADSKQIYKHIPSMPDEDERVNSLTFFTACYIYHASTFLSKELYDDLGPFNKLSVMDYDYWLRAEERGYAPMIVQDYWASFRFHEVSKSFDFVKVGMEAQQVRALHLHKLKGKDREIADKFYGEEAWLLFKLGVLQAIHRGQRGKAMAMCLRKALHDPKVLTERWYLGLWTRQWKGVDIGEFDRYGLMGRDEKGQA